MGRLEAKHWALIGAFLTSTATLIGGLEHWSDITPLFVAGALGQIGALLGALFAGAPQNPHWRTGGHPKRRHYDEVSESTRERL